MTINKNSNGVSVPRFFYRDVQQSLSELQAEANRLGSTKEAMRQYLAPYASRLPAEYTVDRLVDDISETTRVFCEAEANITKEDIRNKLKEFVETHTEEEAFCYLSVLEATCTAFDADANDRMNMMSEEEIETEIQRVMQNPGEVSLAERIDEMVDAISQDGLKIFVFTEGNEQILEAIDAGQDKDAQQVRNALDGIFEKTDRYAMAACVCYSMILNGKVDGMTVENADPRIVATLVSAGLSKGFILSRLFRGEITLDDAKKLLEHVENAVKWVLTAFYQALIGAGVFLALSLVLGMFEITGKAAVLLLAMFALCSIGVASDEKKDAQEFADLLVGLTKFAIQLPIKLGRFIHQNVKNYQQTRQTQQYPQKPVQA